MVCLRLRNPLRRLPTLLGLDVGEEPAATLLTEEIPGTTNRIRARRFGNSPKHME